MCWGVYLALNTSQAASVRFARAQQAAKYWRKGPQAIFDMLKGAGFSRALMYYSVSFAQSEVQATARFQPRIRFARASSEMAGRN